MLLGLRKQSLETPQQPRATHTSWKMKAKLDPRPVDRKDLQELYNSIQVVKEARILNTMTAQEKQDIEKEIEAERLDWRAKKK